MCDPTGGVATAALLAASTAVTAYGQYQSGQAAQEAAEYNAAVQRNNAIMEDRRAAQEMDRGEREAIQRRRQIAQLIGQQRARAGASGVEGSTGSLLDVQIDTAQQGVLDLQTIRYNADIRAQDRRFAAQNLRDQATLTEMEGDAAARAGTLSAFGTILGGAASVSGSLGPKPFGGRLGSLRPQSGPVGDAVKKGTRRAGRLSGKQWG